MENQKLEIIDIHTHIFNLNSLPLRGILQAHKVPHSLAATVALLFKMLTKKSHNRSHKETFFNENDDAFSLELISANEDTVIEYLSHQVTDDMFYNPSFQKKLELTIIEDNLKLDDDLLAFLFNDKSTNNFAPSNMISRIVRKIFDAIKDVFHYIKWFFFMARSEEKIIQKLYDSYGKDINKFAFMMMDADHFFEGRARLSMKQKVKNMRHHIRNNSGRLIGFVAYNPRRPNNEGMFIVKDAIENGFSGVKFYPPLGYRASQNDKQKHNYPNVFNGGNVEKNVNTFFEYCLKYDVPVFTHCTPEGFEAIPKKSGVQSDPIFWEYRLKEMEQTDLRLCLGHAGGEEGWATKSDEKFRKSYAYKVYELCTTYPNVYCEVGFLAHIKDETEKNNFIQRLQNLISSNKGKYDFGKKIMFGSDWHILFNCGLELNYHKRFIEIFSNPILSDYKVDFFAENAKRYLKQTLI